MVGCLIYRPHSCFPPLSLRKPDGQEVALPHFVCVFEIFREGDDWFVLFVKVGVGGGGGGGGGGGLVITDPREPD